jgi:hypothetical protein
MPLEKGEGVGMPDIQLAAATIVNPTGRADGEGWYEVRYPEGEEPIFVAETEGQYVLDLTVRLLGTDSVTGEEALVASFKVNIDVD